MKKVISFLLTLALVFTCTSIAFAEYDTENVHFGGVYPIVDDPSAVEPLQVVVKRDSTNVLVDVKDSAQVQWIYEKTGVPIEWIEIEDASYKDQVNLMIASNELPDMFYHTIGDSTINQYMGDDIFVALDEYIDEYAPNIAAAFEKKPEYKALSTSSDGHIYGFPYVEELNGLTKTGGGVVINKNWLDQLGLEVPTTTDDLYNVLCAFAAGGDLNGNGEDDEVALAINFVDYSGRATWCPFFLLNACFGEHLTAGDSYPYLNASKDGVISFGANGEAFKENLKYFASLYKAGVISDNAFADYNYENDLKGEYAIYGMIAAWSWDEGRVYSEDVRNQYVVMEPVYGPNGDMWNNVDNRLEMNGASYGCITTACDQVELAIAWIDFLSTPEAAITTNWGAEGYVYERNDDGYLTMMVDENGNKVTGGYENNGILRWTSSPLSQGPYMVLSEYLGVYGDGDIGAVGPLANQRINGKDQMLEDVTGIPPTIPMTQDEQNEYAQVQPAVENLVKAYIVSAILDDNVDETWDSYCTSLEDAGLEKMVSLVQSAYDRYLEAMK